MLKEVYRNKMSKKRVETVDKNRNFSLKMNVTFSFFTRTPIKVEFILNESVMFYQKFLLNL